MKESDIILTDFGKLVKKKRIEKGLSMVELGYRCNMDKPNMSRIENGNTNPTLTTIVRICTALEINLSELFNEFIISKE